MKTWDVIGYLASGLVITAFCMKNILRLRVIAVASNVAFLTYGLALGLVPVWLLHLLLLPVNLGRLWQMGNHVAAQPALGHAKARLGMRRMRDRRRTRTQIIRTVGVRFRHS